MGKLAKSSPMRDRFTELRDFISQQSEGTTKGNREYPVKNTGNSVSTRKQRRKAERKMLKMRKNAFKQGKELPTLESVEREKRKQEEEERQKVKAEKQKIKNRAKRKKKKLRKQRKAEEEKLALSEANKQEDREIKLCEKLLRLNKRKSKTISLGFKNDGLDFLLEAVDPEYLQSMYDNGEDCDVSESIMNMKEDSTGSDQSDASELTDDDMLSDASSNESSADEDVSLPQNPGNDRIIRQSTGTSSEDESTFSKHSDKSKTSEKKKVRFDVENDGKISEVEDTRKMKGVKQKREMVCEKEGISNSKKLKVDPSTESDIEPGSENSKRKSENKKHKTEQTKSGSEPSKKQGEKVKKNVNKTKKDLVDSVLTEKCNSQTKSDICEKSKTDKHCIKENKIKLKHLVKTNEKKSRYADMENSNDSSDSSFEDLDGVGSDNSLGLGTRVLEVKGRKEPVDDSLDYIYGVEDSVSDREESGDLPSSAMENSMSLTSDEDSEGDELVEDMTMATNSLDDSDLEDSDLEGLEDDLESESELTEDIYGRLRDKEGNIIERKTTQKSTGAYVPPAKRLEGQSDKKRVEVERMRKQLKGLLNRVSESNMQNIANQIEELFRTHSRADTTEALTDLILGACVASYMVPERLVMEQCMLLAVLHHNIGSEVGGMFLQSVVRQFNDFYTNPTQGKEIHNVVTVLGNLYNFKVVHSVLVFDVLKKFTERFGESDIEVILVILKSVGFTLRKEDPASLKEFILNVQTVAASVNTEQFTDKSRVQFMLDVILHIKNNNMRKIPNYDPSHLDHLRKVIRNHIRGGCYGNSQLRISLCDLLQAEKRGKWWLVGSAWSGHTDTNQERKDPDTSQTVSSVTGVSQKLLDLAQKQRMNTEVRRNIFCVIMTCEDFVDCFEKLLRLGLKHQQEREIIHVIVDLCLQEKSFNPFYAFLSQKFCEYHRRFQMTLQFHLWDQFKELSTMSKVKLDHLSKLLTHLVATGALSLSVLKVLEFAELDKYKMVLIRTILTSLLTDYDESVTQKAFLRIAPLSNLEMLREGLSVFMRHFIGRKKHKDRKGDQSETMMELLKERVDMADRCLNSKQQVKM